MCILCIYVTNIIILKLFFSNIFKILFGFRCGLGLILIFGYKTLRTVQVYRRGLIEYRTLIFGSTRRIFWIRIFLTNMLGNY